MTAARTDPSTGSESAPLASLRPRLRSRLGIDPRALGAFRIGLALVLLADLLVLRLPGLTTFYTDDGVLPRSALAETSPAFARWSLHAQSGSLWAQALLVGIAVTLAGCLLVGYRSRFAAVGSALLLASLHARNPYLTNGGDTILVSLLFLAAFLPLDARWSLRGRRRRAGSRATAAPRAGDATRGDDPRVVSAATATVLLHVAIIYAINAVLKFRSDAWSSGVAVRRIFQLEDFVYLLGPTVAEFPGLLTAINWLWTATLCAAVLLVVATDRLRAATVAAFVGAHLGMAATMRLGAFPFVMLAALLLYLPPRIWDPIDRSVSATALADRVGRLAAEPVADGAGAEGPAAPDSGTDRSRLVRRGGRLAATVLLTCVLLAVVGWQVAAAGLIDTAPADDDAFESGSWAFFAPNPPDSYAWYVVEADRESGDAVDLVDGGPVEFDRPPNAMDRYPSTLWKRFATKVQGGGDAHLEPTAAYFCERAPADVESVTIHRLDQPVDANGPVGDPTADERITTSCG